MKKSSIFNKSSESMAEVGNDSVDLIVAGVPYGMGTIYGKNKDNQGISEYKKMMEKIIRECFRVLKNDGTFLLEAADTILKEGMFVQLAGMLQEICIKSGFSLVHRHVVYVNSSKGMELPEESTNNYSSEKNCHSNCHQWLVFAKKSQSFDENEGRIFYSNYVPSLDHPCPFPNSTCEIILDRYFREGFVVLDPFMGTANIGSHAISRGGLFVGYEMDKDIFNSAKKRLKL